jgi:glucose/mannose transport system substrate-binding protein
MGTASSSVADRSRIEILQHWAAEGADPLAAIIEEFERQHADVQFDNRAEHVSSLRLVVKSQVLREEPPDLWVEWPGKNIELAVEAGVVADLTDLWREAGFADAYVAGAKDAARFGDRYHCLPTDMYRINNLFYNTAYAERAGVDVDGVETPAGFVEMLAALDDALDVPAIVLNGKDPFGPLQLWETFVLAHGGVDAYDDLLEGQGHRQRKTVEGALRSLDRTLEYAPADVSFVSSAESDAAFAEGEAAVTHNGGWAVGRMKNTASFTYGTDWEYAPFPGTTDVFQMNMNAIVPAAHTAAEPTVRAFLDHVGSPASLERITDAVGAVPPRTDVPVENLHPVTQRHHRALETTRSQALSMTHGLGVVPDQLIALKAAVGTFMRDRDVAATTDEIVETLSTAD